MKKTLLSLLALCGVGTASAQCILDTLWAISPHTNDLVYPIVMCHENPIDTIVYGDPRFSFPGPYDLGCLSYSPFFVNYNGMAYLMEGFVFHSCPVQEMTQLYGIAMVGGFSSTDTDSLEVVFAACTLRNGRMTVIDTVTFNSYRVVNAFEYWTRDSAGKRTVNYPYLYEFYFDQPYEISADSIYIGALYIRDKFQYTYPTPLKAKCAFTLVGDMNWSDTGIYPHWIYNPVEEKWEYQVFTSLYNWAGYFAIGGPDVPRCAKPHAPVAVTADKGQAILSWETCFCDSVQLDVLSLDSAGISIGSAAWVALPGDDTSTTVSGLHEGTYAVRLRTSCHHICPNHDTIIWTDWSDATQFTIGDTTGADTTAIGPVPGVQHAALVAVPNPTVGVTTVEVPEAAVGTALEVLDLEGRLLSRLPITGTRLEVDLRAYPAGTYLLRAAGATLRVVKQ